MFEVELFVNMTHSGWAYEGVNQHAVVDNYCIKLWPWLELRRGLIQLASSMVNTPGVPQLQFLNKGKNIYLLTSKGKLLSGLWWGPPTWILERALLRV